MNITKLQQGQSELNEDTIAFSNLKELGNGISRQFVCGFDTKDKCATFIQNHNELIDELERRQDMIGLLQFEITKLKQQ